MSIHSDPKARRFADAVEVAATKVSRTDNALEREARSLLLDVEAYLATGLPIVETHLQSIVARLRGALDGRVSDWTAMRDVVQAADAEIAKCLLPESLANPKPRNDR